MSDTFPLTAGITQGGVLSSIFLCGYVDFLLNRLESSNFECWIGDRYVGCVLYAHDLIFISASISDLQQMINRVLSDVNRYNMKQAVGGRPPRYAPAHACKL